MAITTTAGTWSWSSALRGRHVSGLGILAATVRLSVEQLFGQAVGDVGRTMASLVGGTGPLDGIRTALVGSVTVADDWTFGVVGFVLLLLLPVGGPVWAGLVPVGVTVAAVRTGARRLGVGAAPRGERHPRVRVVPNAQDRRAADDGVVTLQILIVDDSHDFRELARSVLVKDGMEVVCTASTGAEALAAVAGLRPQVALVDVNLGAESGFDVARRLMAGAAEPRPVVVMMSTYSEEDLADGIAGSPVAGFVAKQRLSGDAVRAVLATSGL